MNAIDYLNKLLRNAVNEGQPFFLSYFFAILITFMALGLRIYFDEAFGDRIFVTYVLTIPIIAIAFGYGPGLLALILSNFLVFAVQPAFISASYTKMTPTVLMFALIYFMYIVFLLAYIRGSITKVKKEGSSKIEAVKEVVRDQKETISLIESAMQRANDVIIIAKMNPEMSVVYVNEAFTLLTGYSAEEVIGKTPKILHGPKTDLNSLMQIKQSIQNGKPIRKDILNYRKNGSEFWVELDIAPITSHQGDITHWVSIQREITSRKDYEASLLWGQKQARLALEARSLFIAKMSHEMRTPMTGILGMSTLALKQDASVELKKYLNAIYESSLALMKVLNDILDFSKLESGFMTLELREFKLSSLTGDIQKLFSDAATLKNIQLNSAYSGDEGLIVIGDRFRLTQVIGNLVGNAIKFTEKGMVDLSLNILSQDANKVRVLILIKDTGVGIPLHAQKDIMSSFSQADSSLSRRYGGTGLGLSISSELLHQMNSELLFKSQEGVGSEFYFVLDLPLSEHAKQEEVVQIESKQINVSDSSERSFPFDLSGKNILLVEDNQINQIVVSEFLKLAKATVTIACDGIEAIALFGEGQFDAILMDIQMPKLDGYETTRRIRLTDGGASIPIIGISAGVSEKEISKALSFGMDDFLPKPLNPDAMITALIKHINKL
jgi:PAS domain S-box-containing protein